MINPLLKIYASQIADAMRFYKDSPEAVEQHGQSGGYEFLKKNYDRRQLATKYWELLEKISFTG